MMPENPKTLLSYLLMACLPALLLHCSGTEVSGGSEASTPADCDCPLDPFPTEERTEDVKAAVDKAPELEGKVGAWVQQAEIALEGKAGGGADSSISKIKTYTENRFQGAERKVFLYRIQRRLYCAYYQGLCQDSSLTAAQRRKLSEQKLSELEQRLLGPEPAEATDTQQPATGGTPAAKAEASTAIEVALPNPPMIYQEVSIKNRSGEEVFHRTGINERAISACCFPAGQYQIEAFSAGKANRRTGTIDIQAPNQYQLRWQQ